MLLCNLRQDCIDIYISTRIMNQDIWLWMDAACCASGTVYTLLLFLFGCACCYSCRDAQRSETNTRCKQALVRTAAFTTESLMRAMRLVSGVPWAPQPPRYPISTFSLFIRTNLLQHILTSSMPFTFQTH